MRCPARLGALGKTHKSVNSGLTAGLSDRMELPLTPNLTMIREGKKFMWDGRVFDTQEECLQQAEAYLKDNFEVQTVEQDGKFLVYTRRMVKELVVTQA